MLRRRNIVTSIVMITVIGAAIAWRTVSSRWSARVFATIANTIDADARRVRFSRGEIVFDATVIRLPRSVVHASVVGVAAGQSLAEIAASRDALLAINAGYFDAAFEPLGLLRIDGVDRGTLLRQPPLSGLVLIDVRGTLSLVPRDDPALVSAASAFQAGPFLIDPGGTIGISRSDGPAAERTVIATTDRDIVVIVTSPVTLRDLAECLHDCRAIADGPIDRALNLDGGPSTGFAHRTAASVTTSAPRGRIRNALVFSTR